MDISTIGQQPPTSKAEAQVDALKKTTDQQAQTTATIINSVTQNAPTVEPTKGQNLAKYA